MTRFFLGLLSAGALACSTWAQAPVEPILPKAPIAAKDCAPAAPCSEPAAKSARFYGGAEWLYWTVQGNALPALVTTSVPGTVTNLGQLGSPTTVIIGGGNRANDDFRNGVRGTLGYWFDDRQKTGFEVSYFLLEDSREGSRFTSNTTPILAVPVSLNGNSAANVFAVPPFLTGGIAVSSAQELEGGSALLRRNLRCSGNNWIDVLGGYRYLNAADELSLVAGVPFPASPVFNATFIDTFNTRNIFHGGTLGFAAGHKLGGLTLEGRASCALGTLNRSSSIGGVTIFNNVPVLPFGITTTPTNIGTYEDDTFAVVPEASARVAWQATEHLRLTIGYDWLMMTNVLRSGDQVDQASGNGRPTFPNRDTTMFVHGASLGFEVRY